jgi:hypothetical protein
MIRAFKNLIQSNRTFWFLFLLNILIGGVIFGISSGIDFPDANGYWLMGESLMHGKFSSWHFLPKYYPETLRTPGYPLFLALCQLFSKSLLLPKLIQFVLYFVSVFLVTRVVYFFQPNISYRNLFLLILIPNVQIVYYTGYISAEILNVFFITLAAYILTLKRSWINVFFLALVCYVIFIIRPAFLLFPLVIAAYLYRSRLNYALLFLFTYSLLLLPFGYWNYKNHGEFKLTTIEGGAGVAHLGFWAYKLPTNYIDSFYWGNKVISDLTNPFSFSQPEFAINAKSYNSECTLLWNRLSVYLTKEDSIYLMKMKNNPYGIFLLYNSQYTLARESALKNVTIEHIKNEPLYYLKTRFYSLFRNYVTGINEENFHKATSLREKLKCVYPFLVTFVFIFVGLIFVTYTALNQRFKNQTFILLLLMAWYYGLVHIPFSIQARYTIPIHLIILSLLPFSLRVIEFESQRAR